jgi:hypothetical protein
MGEIFTRFRATSISAMRANDSYDMYSYGISVDVEGKCFERLEDERRPLRIRDVTLRFEVADTSQWNDLYNTLRSGQELYLGVGWPSTSTES